MAGKKNTIESYDYRKIAFERSLWVLKYVAVVVIISWVLHPSTSRPEVLNKNIPLGFLFGAFYGLFIYKDLIKYYLVDRRKNSIEIKNRIPEEFYFGDIVNRLDKK